MLADIRCCLASLIYSDEQRSQIGHTLLSHLEDLLIEAESCQQKLKGMGNAGAPDMVINALGDAERFGRRLDHLVYLLCVFAVDSKPEPTARLFVASRIPAFSSSTSSSDRVILTVQQRLSLLIAAAYPLSHAFAGTLVRKQVLFCR